VDTLWISDLYLYGHTGVYPEEKILGVQFRLDLELSFDQRPAALSDQLSDTLDYGVLVGQLQALVQVARFDLLETLAQALADLVLSAPQVQAVQLTLTKCHPPLPYGPFSVGVQILRTKP